MIEINKKNIRVWSMLGMRRIVGPALKDIAEKDDNFIFATADLGRYFAYEDLVRSYPDKVIDLGIAEQNLIGASAAMQNEGFHVFAATYATFITARVLDQIRVNMGLMNLGVKLIGAAGGLCDGNFSATHMALEDFADMRAIPNMTVLAPADGMELVKTLVALSKHDGPAYVRLTGRANIPVIYKEDYDFQIGKAVTIKEGDDIAIISNGTILGDILKVAGRLEQEKISCRVIDMHTVKPIDQEILREISGYKLVVTVEEHVKAGGLGSVISEFYAEEPRRPIQQMIAIDDYYPDANEYDYLLDKCGLTEEKMLSKILKKYRLIY